MENKSNHIELHLGEFVANPTESTQKLIDIVVGLNNHYTGMFKTETGLQKFKNEYKLRLYLKEAYKDYYKELREFNPDDYMKKLEKMGSRKRLETLYSDFEKIYDKIIFNNFVLAYEYVKNKRIINTIKTIEDEKIGCLKLFSEDKITRKEFNERFGHHALNAFELSSKRFGEYSDEELKSIAKLVSSLADTKKITLEEYLTSNSRDRIPVLIALRELGRHNILYLVKAMRAELLEIAGEKGIEDVFNKTYEEVIAGL